MIKFVVLLTSAITFNFTLTFGEMLGITASGEKEEIQLVFSEKPIGFESGQPVYPINTKVFVKCSGEKELSISVNGGKELKKNTTKVDLSNYLMPHADTYTILVQAKGDKKSDQQIFGFTTK